MGKLERLGLEPAVCYERERPGELIHIDIKRLGKIQRGAGSRFTGPAARSLRSTRKDPLGVRRQTAGWECVHIAIDDCTRLAYAEVLPDQSRRTGRAMAGMLAVLAQFERELIGQRTAAALAVKKAQGMKLPRPSLVPLNVRSRIVTARKRGTSYAAIARALNADGVPTGQGGAQWWPSSVKAVGCAALRRLLADWSVAAPLPIRES
jgi:resolvase-like protein